MPHGCRNRSYFDHVFPPTLSVHGIHLAARVLAQRHVPIEDSFEVRGPPRSIASWWRLTHIPTRATETLRFAESDERDAYGFGWSGFETYKDRDWRWAIGREADLYLKLDPNRDARILLDVGTHGPSESHADRGASERCPELSRCRYRWLAIT